MSDLIVAFACNDDGGDFSGELNAVEFTDDDGETVLSFVMLDVPMTWPQGEDLIAFGVGSDWIQVRGRGRRRWVGNMAWDDTRMELAEAERLARWLIANADKPNLWVPDHPIGRLGETEVRAR
jgi:hypothetical protein